MPGWSAPAAPTWGWRCSASTPATSGEIVFEEQAVKIQSPEQAMKLGIAYVTEDRRQLGLVLPMSIVVNITLPTLPRYLNRLGLIRRGRGDRDRGNLPQQLSIRTPR